MKKHGNTGNAYARHGDENKDVMIRVRCTQTQRAAWKAKAEKAGMTLSAWIEKKLEK